MRLPHVAVVPVVLFAGALAAQEPLSVVPPAAPGEPLRLTYRPAAPVVWVTVFHRVLGAEGFQSKTFVAADGGFEAVIPPEELGGPALEYYLAIKEGEAIRYLPEGAPTTLARVELGASVLPLPVGPVHRWPLRVEANLEQLVHRSQPVPGERTRFSGGQVALGYELEAGDHRLSLATRLAYQGQPLPGQDRWAVAELRGRYGFRAHSVQVGDLVVQESEFSVGGMGRRGFGYRYDDSRHQAHLFAVNTVQLPGFRGLAWPVRGTELFGGSYGTQWREGTVKAKLVFLTGTDDPASALNAASMPFLSTPRAGTTVALTSEAALLDQRLSLAGEYARARTDRNLEDEVGALEDQAWRIGGAWTVPTYSVRASYRHIGRDFNTLGLPVLAGDRRGVEAGASLTLDPRWSLNASLTSELNNPSGNPLETRARNDARTVDARWMAREGLTLKAGLTQGSQEAANPSDPYVPFASSDRLGLFGGFDWTVGVKGAVTFQVQLDRLEGTGAAPSQGRGTTVTLGGSWLEPDRLRVAPTFSFARQRDEVLGLQTDLASAFLNGEVTLVTRQLILALTGGWSRTRSTGMDPASSHNVDAALQYHLTPHLEKRFQRGQAMVALRFRLARLPGLPEVDRRTSLTLNVAF